MKPHGYFQHLQLVDDGLLAKSTANKREVFMVARRMGFDF